MFMSLLSTPLSSLLGHVGVGSLVWGYLDPGSGSLLLQLLIAGLLSGTFFLKSTMLYVRGLVAKVAR